ncbi:MAG: cobaltochelatase subunit CobN, partial [Caldimicrobium sp.]|nr:cobaltochelatase subunit CobN [Caldimicrobium sp.]
HFGTHGTQEWTPGKERALDKWDFPYLTLGEIPVIYPYIVDNIGEAINAKRRGRALIISHQTPAFAPAGTYGDLEEIHQLLHSETSAEGRIKQKLREKIAEKSLKSKLAQDIGFRDKKQILQNFEEFSERLHSHIHDIASQNIPLGLHTFGKDKEKEHLILTILQILGKEWIKRWEQVEYEEFLSQPLDKIKKSRAFEAVHECVFAEATDLDTCEGIKKLFNSFKAQVELDSFFRALEGGYIRTSYGGDPIRVPESLPTGRNLYGFDPTRVPTKVAWDTAVEMIKEWLDDYLKKHGEYPRKVAFSLWSTETMRHQGVIEAQIFYLLGVKPKWDQFGRVWELEIIPREELGRPRIDVVVSATGLYRDHFPNLMALINKGVRMVAELTERDNYVAENTNTLIKDLVKKGMDPEKAKNLSTVRVFSNEAGVYGTGLDEAVFRTRNRTELTQVYLHRMSFVYDEETYSQRIEGLYEANLREVRAVILSRSSNLYGMLSTDDPFQYLGGLSLAVEVISGRKPEVLIANLRSTARMQKAEDFLVSEVRSRYLNPNYLKEMMKEGASGVSQVLDTVNNLYGWQVIVPQVVKDYIWQEFKEIILQDKYNLGLKEWFKTNPLAFKELKKRIEQGLAISGYGLESPSNKGKEPNLAPNTLRGNLLERVTLQSKSERTPPAWINFYMILLMFFWYTLGFISSLRKRYYI